LIGYSCQGFGKFGFYEMFKDVYKWMLGPKAAQYQTIGFLASSACAEVIADTFLAPFEAVSITKISGLHSAAILPLLTYSI
jgi:solute carrier family 25 (mitochondrial phosphate transporter), member 3